ncbi:hypothetical protein A6S26_19735 [Nostoc sp. ATCC 43529]|nr:hypothetical protein A6S26_19735 [Nostoc sp. ATCC 43529]
MVYGSRSGGDGEMGRWGDREVWGVWGVWGERFLPYPPTPPTPPTLHACPMPQSPITKLGRLILILPSLY